jgi:hypothetical protein
MLWTSPPISTGRQGESHSNIIFDLDGRNLLYGPVEISKSCFFTILISYKTTFFPIHKGSCVQLFTYFHQTITTYIICFKTFGRTSFGIKWFFQGQLTCTCYDLNFKMVSDLWKLIWRKDVERYCTDVSPTFSYKLSDGHYSSIIKLYCPSFPLMQDYSWCSGRQIQTIGEMALWLISLGWDGCCQVEE